MFDGDEKGATIGLTIGRGNTICSYTRNYSKHIQGVSKEWAILPLNAKSGVFSAKGDSGAAIIDGNGRLGGLLTGGNGVTVSSDITYTTPIGIIVNEMRKNGIQKPNVVSDLTLEF